jgi:hypothetical protein
VAVDLEGGVVKRGLEKVERYKGRRGVAESWGGGKEDE